MKQIGSIEKIRKFNAKFDNSFVWQVAEMLAVSPHFHGQFTACGDWQQLPTLELEEKSFASARVRTVCPVVQSVVRHYTDWATPAHT
jgi:hypothetical protein